MTPMPGYLIIPGITDRQAGKGGKYHDPVMKGQEYRR